MAEKKLPKLTADKKKDFIFMYNLQLLILYLRALNYNKKYGAIMLLTVY